MEKYFLKGAAVLPKAAAGVARSSGREIVFPECTFYSPEGQYNVLQCV